MKYIFPLLLLIAFTACQPKTNSSDSTTPIVDSLSQTLEGIAIIDSALIHEGLNASNPNYTAEMKALIAIADKAEDAVQGGKLRLHLATYHSPGDPNKSIELLYEAGKLLKGKDDKLYGFAIQNTSQIYSEKLDDQASSLVFADSSINHWRNIHQPSTSNMLKFKALILGKLGRYAEAKKAGFESIKIATEEDLPRLLSVCYYDMAQVYDNEGKLDSAETYAKMSLDIQYNQERKNLFRINVVNVFLFELYVKYDIQDKANYQYQLCSNSIDEKNSHYYLVTRFYEASIKHFKEDKKQAKEYEERLEKYKKELQKKGIQH